MIDQLIFLTLCSIPFTLFISWKLYSRKSSAEVANKRLIDVTELDRKGNFDE